MNPIQRTGGTVVTLWRALPVPGRIVVAVVGLVTLLYVWQILLGLFVLTAFFVGAYHLLKWFVSSK